MLEGNKKNETDNGPKDDVTGASVTANNASARLSSLEHCPNASRVKKHEELPPYESTGEHSSSDDSLLAGVEEKKKNGDASDDSGYRVSNDSREESSSSWSDTSRSNGKAIISIFSFQCIYFSFVHVYVFSHFYSVVLLFRSSEEAACTHMSNVSYSRRFDNGLVRSHFFHQK